MSLIMTGSGGVIPISIGIEPDGAAVAGGDGATFITSITETEAGRVKVGGDGFGRMKFVLGDCVFFSGIDRHRGNVTLSEILRSLKREIVDAGVFQDHHVYIRLDLAGQSENPPNADNYLEIFLLNELTDQNTLSGGGTEVGDMRSEPIEFKLYHHLGLDQKNRHTHWTTDLCRGASRKTDELLKVIQLLDIKNDSGTGILAEPMRVQSPTGFQVDRRGWGFVAIRAEIIYTAELELVP